MKDMGRLYDAIIIGAGAAGNYLAYRLAGLGYEVLVVEEHEKVGQPVNCTGIIGAECVERFPLFEGTVLREVSSARLFSPSGSELRVSRDSVQAFIIDRAAFDRALAERAQLEGAQYLLGCRAEDVEIRDEVIRVKAEGRILEGKTAVVASGFGSPHPQKLGMGRIGDLVMGAQVEVSTDGLWEVEVYFDQEMTPGFFAWLVPTSQKRALVGLFSRRNPGAQLKELLSRLAFQGKIATPEAQITYGGIPLRPLPQTYQSRVVAVGDAAGQVKPTTGGGVYYGLLCAEVAVTTLHGAFAAGDFSEALFSRYQRRWKRKIGKELRLGYLARQLYERLSNRQIDHIFHIVESRGILEALLKSDLSFDWHSKAIQEGLKHLGPWRHLFGWRENIFGGQLR